MSNDELKTAIDYMSTDEHLHVVDSDGTIYRIEKKSDPDPDDPSKWESNLGTIACWHTRYTLGNENPKDDPQNWLAMKFKDFMAKDRNARSMYEYLRANQHGTHVSMRDNANGGQTWTLFYGSMIDDPNDVFTVTVADPADIASIPQEFFDACCEEMSTKERIAVLNRSGWLFLPLFLMDHSGLSMSTEDFNDRWDSGQVGWIYTEKSRAEKLWCADWDIDRARQELKDQVMEYDKFLRGEYYGIIVSRFEPWDHDDPEKADEAEFVEEDSCWGLSDAGSMADFILETTGPCEEYSYKDPEESPEPVVPDWRCVFCGSQVTGRLVGPKKKFYGTCDSCGAVYHQ